MSKGAPDVTNMHLQMLQRAPEGSAAAVSVHHDNYGRAEAQMAHAAGAWRRRRCSRICVLHLPKLVRGTGARGA